MVDGTYNYSIHGVYKATKNGDTVDCCEILHQLKTGVTSIGFQ